jgi:Fe-S-cluster containining protein
MLANWNCQFCACESAGGATHLPPLPSEERFACLPGCGLCCSYHVLVTEVDRQRLRAVATDAEAWDAAANGELALRRVSGFCLYLDPQQRCTVYEHRPEHCRAYPYLWTTYERAQLDVDFSCPGLGRGNPIPAEWHQPPVETTQRLAQREEAIRELQGLLRALRRYTAPEVLVALGERALDELAAIWPTASSVGSSTMRVSQRRPLKANPSTALRRGSGQGSGHRAETPDDLTALWQGLSLTPRPVEELVADAVFMKRHFGRPRWNTRLGSEGEVALYRFWIAEGVLHVEERGGKRQAIPLGDVGQLPWHSEALATRRAYLQRWLERQLLVRLANNLAVASLLPGGHVATCYLQFLTEVDWRLAVLAPALTLASGKEAIDRAVALEAVRGSDGLLRAWCQSARLGATN